MAKPLQANSAEIMRLRQVMLEKHLTPAALGKLTGFDPRRISNQLCATDTTWPIRAAINRAMQEKIFSNPSASYRARRKHTQAPTPAPSC
jgi:hypothetical protein